MKNKLMWLPYKGQESTSILLLHFMSKPWIWKIKRDKKAQGSLTLFISHWNKLAVITEVQWLPKKLNYIFVHERKLLIKLKDSKDRHGIEVWFHIKQNKIGDSSNINKTSMCSHILSLKEKTFLIARLLGSNIKWLSWQ